MPNFYTHLRFGREVAEHVSPELKKRLYQEWDSYCCGNFGPDPLFFGSLRQVGLRLHHGSGEKALERYRSSIREDQPYGVSFAAGYFLHHLLDSTLHPLVYMAMEKTGCSHRQVEGELDRLLLERDKLVHREAMPVRPMPRAFYYMASRMAPEVTPEAYEAGLKNFRFLSMKLCDWTGTPMRHVMNAAGRVVGKNGIRGAVLNKLPDPKLERHLEELEQCYWETVSMAPEALEEFIKNAQQGEAFSSRLRVDFAGKEVE